MNKSESKLFMYIFLLFILSLFGALIINIQTMLFMWFVYFIGSAITCGVNRGDERKIALKIFQILFFAGFAYLLLYFSYMLSKNYQYILVFDSYDVFFPNILEYIEEGSYMKSISSIWENYDFFNRFQTGYYTYAVSFAYISELFGADFEFGQHLSVLLLYPFVGIMIYKLLKINYFNETKAYKYTLIISLFSIVFSYSSVVLRDMHILLFSLIGIYYTFNKRFSLKTLAKIVVIIYIVTLFRIESGLFLALLIPAYLLSTLHTSKYKALVIGASFAIVLGALVLIVAYYDDIQSVYEFNQGAYVEKVQDGSGMIATLQRIPIAGDLASIMYNAVQPLPFWSRFTPPMGDTRLGAEVYNVMNFPRSFAAFFNWFVVLYILAWVFIRGLRDSTKGLIQKPFMYQLWIGLIFLFIQSAVVSQRRLMPYYVVFYLFFFLIYDNMQPDKKKYLNIVVVGLYVMLQLVGVVYKI